MAQSLCELTYHNNPNFLNMTKLLNLPFKPHSTFKKQDIADRQKLYKEICTQIWQF